MYYLTFDGEFKQPVSSNLKVATIWFWWAVKKNEWCPALVDEEGVVLISWDNSDPYHCEDHIGTIIGPEVDAQWVREYADYPDRGSEEHDYKFGEWRL